LVKIYYHHTDAGGVVYYANYLKFLEEARTEYLADRGVAVKELVDKGILFVVARQEIDYKLPAYYADTLKIDTRITDISAVRINFENEIKNQHNQVVAKAKTVLVCVDKLLKPQAIPEEIRQQISQE
jgi:acyl-CoA thioester hydrolase